LLQELITITDKVNITLILCLNFCFFVFKKNSDLNRQDAEFIISMSQQLIPSHHTGRSLNTFNAIIIIIIAAIYATKGFYFIFYSPIQWIRETDKIISLFLYTYIFIFNFCYVKSHYVAFLSVLFSFIFFFIKNKYIYIYIKITLSELIFYEIWQTVNALKFYLTSIWRLIFILLTDLSKTCILRRINKGFQHKHIILMYIKYNLTV